MADDTTELFDICEGCEICKPDDVYTDETPEQDDQDLGEKIVEMINNRCQNA